MLFNEILETEMRVKGKVVLQVGGGKHIPVYCEGFAGHELHELFAEISD